MQAAYISQQIIFEPHKHKTFLYQEVCGGLLFANCMANSASGVIC